MPLHLLGKKSWNVYNHDNIEAVRRDEAAAAARQEAREQLMQEQDALRRTAILRGEAPPTFAPLSPEPDPSQRRSRPREGREESKRPRKRHGEDETAYEIRLAQAQAEAPKKALSAHQEAERIRDAETARECDIIDHRGHIQLFAPPDEKQIRRNQKNAEHEAEKRRKEREFEDQYTMRLSNAAGFQNSLSAAPWYADTSKASVGGESGEAVHPKTQGHASASYETEPKNAWGRPDPSRKDRDAKRVGATDPMAFMQKAQSQLRQAEKDKQAWKEQQDAERGWKTRPEDRKQKRERSREGHGRSSRSSRDKSRGEKRRRRAESVDSLEDFSLDTSAPARDDARATTRRSDRDCARDRTRGDPELSGDDGASEHRTRHRQSPDGKVRKSGHRGRDGEERRHRDAHRHR